MHLTPDRRTHRAGIIDPPLSHADKLARVAASVPPSRLDRGAEVLHFANAAAMRAGQWAHGNALPDDDEPDDAAPVDSREDPPQPRPLLDAAAVIAECERVCRASAERTCSREDVGRATLAQQVGYLGAELRQAADLVYVLQAALQMAVEHCRHGDDYLQTDAYQRAVRTLGIVAVEVAHG
jgi:hypothetical protein